MTKTIQLPDASITMEDDGEGAPVLLLHGFSSTRQLWSRVTPGLVDAGFRVQAPDLIGYGTVDAPGHVSVDMVSQAGWMRALLDRLEIDSASIVAHDVGSAVAQILVASARGWVRGLAIFDGVCRDNWAMEALAGIQAWDPADAHRILPILMRRLIRAARDLDPRQTQHLDEKLRISGVPAALSRLPA